MKNVFVNSSFSWLTLFASSGTLICCALPIILVTLGMGATVAALTSSLPFLIVLSQHKIWVFIFSGLMLTISAWFIYRPNQHCPTDPQQAKICNTSKLWNKRIYWFSVILWSIGFIAAFLALPIRQFLGI
jgi:mercuric ion transport protein